MQALASCNFQIHETEAIVMYSIIDTDTMCHTWHTILRVGIPQATCLIYAEICCTYAQFFPVMSYICNVNTTIVTCHLYAQKCRDWLLT